MTTKKYLLLVALAAVLIANAVSLCAEVITNWDAPISEIKYSEVVMAILITALALTINKVRK